MIKAGKMSDDRISDFKRRRNILAVFARNDPDKVRRR
jgi:hypothetical protein